MKQFLCSLWAVIGILFVTTFSMLTPSASGQAVNISLTLGIGGSRQLQFTGNATSYYVLYRGSTVTNLTNAVQVVLGAQPTTSMQDTNPQQSASFYRVLTVDTNAPLDLDADGVNDLAELLAGTNPLVPGIPASSLVINEVDYDQLGTDTGEFIEIYNPTATAVSLSGLKLVFINGANNTQYLSVDLSLAGASLAAGQYLVVKAATVTAAVGALTLNFSAAQDNIQNGAPDGVAIFNSANNTILDALAYEGSVTAAVITGAPGTFNLVEGTALAGSVADSNTLVGSLSRLPNGQDTNNANTDWAFSTTPTPGAANVL